MPSNNTEEVEKRKEETIKAQAPGPATKKEFRQETDNAETESRTED